MERKIELTVHCPVCGTLAFEEEEDYEICPVCWWENDSSGRRGADVISGANKMTLNEYKEAWKAGKLYHGNLIEEE